MPTTLTHAFRAQGKLKPALECRDPEVLIVGPAGTGKSLGICYKIHRMAMLPENAGMRALIVRKTRTSMKESVIETWKTAASDAIRAGVLKPVGGTENPTGYNYTNGSEVVFAGIDQPTKIRSSQWDIVFVEEAIELVEGDWEELSGRLRNGVVSFSQLIGATNPDHDQHWLKKRCDANTTTMFTTTHEDNPAYFDADTQDYTTLGADYIKRLDNLSGTRYLRLRKGIWSSSEGVIYELTDAHQIDRMPPESDGWERWWSVDWGFTNPTVIQCWALDPDGRLYLYREYVHSNRTTEQNAKAILSVVKDGDEWLEPKPAYVIADTDPEKQKVFRNETNLAIRDATKDVGPGIEKVIERLKIADDGLPRLFVVRDCVMRPFDPEMVENKLPIGFLQEVGGYVWDRHPDKPPKEEPVKVNDHSMDAARYMVMHIDSRATHRRTGWV